MIHVTTKPIVAANSIVTVIHPSTFVSRLLVLSPMIDRRFVINNIINSRGGVENP